MWLFVSRWRDHNRDVDFWPGVCVFVEEEEEEEEEEEVFQLTITRL